MRVRTGYSFKTAYGHLPDVISRLVEIGETVAPITDRNSTFGFARWTKAAKAAGLRPVYGIELACVPELGEKRPPADYWTFIAREHTASLSHLVDLAGNNPGREPSLTYAQALRADDVEIIAGERLLVDALPGVLPSSFHGSLAPSSPPGLVRRMAARGIPLVATGDNYYPRPDDLETYRVALGFRSGTQTYPRHILSGDELVAWLEDEGHDPALIADAFARRLCVLDRCRAELKQATLLEPEKPATLREMCEDGAKLLGVDLSDETYAARLTRELDLIHAKNFQDYFYILADLISWAKQRMVVGPARGSSCGSLVCYLLGITAIDPIPFGLIFERFIDVNRMDLPDIDVDFSDKRRHLVFEYAEQRFGRERVARLGTVGMFKARSALNQAGAVLDIPPWRIAKVMDFIIERSSGDSRVNNTLEDTLKETDAGRDLLREYPEIAVAAKMEGHPNVASQHAAGVIITQEPIAEYAALDPRTRSCWVDKKDAEALNMLKVDALGLTQLSVFERTLELIGRPSVSGYLETLPLDDPAAFDVLNRGAYSGIFQFTGNAVRSLAGQIKFEELNDYVAMTALARPGPLASGGSMAWIRRRNGEKWSAAEAIHPLLAELTSETYGVVLYQETVMRITREIGNFSWADTSRIRKLMSSRMGDEQFKGFWEQFKTGAISNGLTEDQARTIWDQINSFGSWAFNKSHAVAYGLISYWCCWLKAHHPLEFAAATLDAEPDPAKQIAILRELAGEGIGYKPIDPDHSTDRWQVSDGALIGPLSAIKGIGPAKMREVIDARRTGEPLRPAIRKQLENARTEIDSLYPIRDRVRELHPDLGAINIFSEPWEAIQVQPGAARGDVMIFGLIRKIVTRDENEPINVVRRGGRVVSGPTAYLNLTVGDDTDQIMCKIDRWTYPRLGEAFLKQARAGKSLFAIKGTVPPSFRMIKIRQVRYLGEIA